MNDSHYRYTGCSYTGVRCLKGILLLSIVLGGTGGCLPIDRIDSIVVVGSLLDAETSVSVKWDTVTVRSFTDGAHTGTARATAFGENAPPGVPRRDSAGEFAAPFRTDITGPGEPPPQFPRPDRVEVIVVRAGCEQSFFIDINAETVVDPAAPDDVLELREPILVPPCEP